MKPTYRVRDWADAYETCETKRLKVMRWVPIPNKHDGAAYRLVASHERACEVFAAWVLIVQVASKCDERGVLRDGKGPIDARRLSLMTGFPQEAFTVAFDVLTDDEIRWLEVLQPGDTQGTCGGPTDIPADSRATNGVCRDEGKGREGNRTKPHEALLDEVSEKRPKPTIDKRDLESVTATEALYRKAVKLGDLQDTEPNRIAFHAIAIRAAAKGRSAGALFTSMVKEKAWLKTSQNGGLSEADCDAARRRLKTLRPRSQLPESNGLAASFGSIPGQEVNGESRHGGS